jgi:hypothetical protein
MTLSLTTFSMTAISIMIFSIMTFSIMIFDIMRLSITTFSLMTLSIMTFNKMTFTIMTFAIVSIKLKDITIIINDTQPLMSLCWLSFMLSVANVNVIILSVAAPTGDLIINPFTSVMDNKLARFPLSDPSATV